MSKRHLISRFLWTLIVVLTALAVHAQEPWEKEGEGEIKDLEIEMTKERKVILPRASRYFDKVPPRPFQPIVPAISYEFKSLSFSSPNYSPVIRPLRLKQEEISRLSGNYVSGGVGNLTSFFVEGAASTKRDKNKLMGVDFSWRGFGAGPVDGDHSANSTTRLSLFGKKISGTVTTTADINYQNNRVYFYGYAPGTDIDRERLKQIYEILSARAGVENSKKGKFNYRFNAGYSYTRDYYVSSESEVTIGFLGQYALDKGRITFGAEGLLISRMDSLYPQQSRNLFRIQPAYEFSPIDKLTIKAGFNVAINNEEGPNVKEVSFYPHVVGRYATSERVTFYASFSGNMDKVNLHTLSAENPWLKSNIVMLHTNRALDIEGGIEGKLGKKITGRAGISFANLKNFYFYQAVRSVFDPAGSSVGAEFDKFRLDFDRATTRVNPFGEVTFTASDVFGVTFRYDYFKYNTDTLPESWHRPDYRADLRVRWNLYEKVSLQAGLIAQGGMVALDPVSGDVVSFVPPLDLTFRARYFFSRQISAFVHLDNVLSSNYSLYMSYPARGFQALVGASWSF